MPEYLHWLRKRIPLLFIYGMALLTIAVFIAIIILARVGTIDPPTIQPPGFLGWLWHSFISTPAPWAVVPGAIMVMGATRLIYSVWGPVDEDIERMDQLRRRLGKILGTAVYAVLSIPYTALVLTVGATLASFSLADYLLNFYPYRAEAPGQVVAAANLWLQGIPGAILFTLIRGLEAGKASPEERARRLKSLPDRLKSHKRLNWLPRGFYLWVVPIIMITGWVLYALYGALLWQGFAVEEALTDPQLYLVTTVAAIFIGWLGVFASSWMVWGRTYGFRMTALSWHGLNMTVLVVALTTLPSVIVPTPAAFGMERLVGTAFEPTTLAITAFFQQIVGALIGLWATYAQARQARGERPTEN